MQRLWCNGLAATLIGMGVACTGGILATIPAHPLVAAVAMALGTFPIALGSAGLLLVRRERVILHSDEIEIVRLGRAPVRLQLSEISGRRVIGTPYATTYVLERRVGPPVRFSITFVPDAVFRAWLESLPDLDAQDFARADAVLLALGRTQAQGLARMRQARHIARALNVATVVACGWGLLAPRPYSLVVALLAATPILTTGALAVGRGHYSVEGARNDPRAMLSAPMVMPGLVLAARSIVDFTTIDHGPLIAASVIGGVAMTACVVAFEPPLLERKASALGLLLIIAVYQWGLAAQVNTLLDGTPVRTSRVAVIGKASAAG